MGSGVLARFMSCMRLMEEQREREREEEVGLLNLGVKVKGVERRVILARSDIGSGHERQLVRQVYT